ncbi:MAG: bifunctional phosphopantothenoylcysteine decarboxylase/phosphopantothenate--cysteine ligase CoaBC [Candidatus Dormibacteria bacterium]
MAQARGRFINARVVVHVCGGIAAVKVPELISGLRREGAEVRVALTSAAASFVSPLSLRALSGHPVQLATEEALEGAGMPHLELSWWADLHLVVPATASTLARLAAGIADDVVASTLLATVAPVLVAPAMETTMWQHPATRDNCSLLMRRGMHFVGPVSGRLASGKEGDGRMAEPTEILAAAASLLVKRGLLAGVGVLVTSGGTREAVDPVRYLGNRSSGRMGLCLAEEAAWRGASVQLVTAASLSPQSPSVAVARVETAQEMLDASLAALPKVRLVLMAAAVADYRVARPATSKLHRGDAPELRLELVPTVDVLGSILANRSPGCRVVGFAAETDEVRERGLAKLASKGCDMLVANPVSGEHSAMGGDSAEGIALLADGREVSLPWASKEEVAKRIMDLAQELLELDQGVPGPE